MANQRTTKERVAVIETEVKDVKSEVGLLRTDVKKILVNHLPHIRQEIAINKVKLIAIVGGVSMVVSSIISVVIGKIIDRFL